MERLRSIRVKGRGPFSDKEILQKLYFKLYDLDNELAELKISRSFSDNPIGFGKTNQEKEINSKRLLILQEIFKFEDEKITV